MGARIARIISVITILSVFCMLLTSCGNKKMPAYVLEASEASGIVQVYNAYFELDGNSLKEVKLVRFENLIQRTNAYAPISFQTYSFKADSTNGNPSEREDMAKSEARSISLSTWSLRICPGSSM